MRYFTTVLAAVAFAGLGGAARADYVAGDTFSYGSYELLGGNTHITDNALGILNETGGAGAIKLKQGGGSVWAFCVDLQDWLTPSGSFTFAATTAPHLAGAYAQGISKIAAITAVLQFGADVYGSFPFSQTLGSSSQRNEAAQLAIWRIEYGAGLSLTPDDSAINAIVTSDLNQIATWVSHTTGTALQMQPLNTPNQMLIYLDSPASIPEPGAVGLLGLGLLGVGAATARRRLGRAR